MGSKDERWSLELQDKNGEKVEVRFHNYTTKDGSNVSVEMGPDWKNTFHENNGNDNAPNYHESVYYGNKPYEYNDEDKVGERKTWYDDNGNIKKQESYDDEGNVTDHTDDDSYDGNDGGCFLTSACIHYRNLPDDCIELATLRRFRDDYLQNTEEGEHLIKEYYRIAPQIVKKINGDKHRDEYYKSIYHTILRCIESINSHDYMLATKQYYDMTIRLKKTFGIN